MSADADSAARALARTVAAVVSHEAVRLTVKNLSTLGATETAEIRGVFESELKAVGQPAAEVRIAISENLTHFLLVAEIQRGGERQVLLESWPRTAAASTSPQDKPPQVTLEKKLLWEQDRPILDAAQVAGGILVLDADRVLLVRGADRQSAPIVRWHSWPRDLRGRLSVSDTAFIAYLPGDICRGETAPRLSVACEPSQEPWLLAPGAIALFTPDRNLFQGHIDIAPGGPRDLPPFYSAAHVGGTWIVAGADGRAQLYREWDASSAIGNWGSDNAAIETPCGPRVLVTRPTTLAEPDAIQPYEIVNDAPNLAGTALEFSGPITALWSAGSTVTAVSHDLQTGHYAAFSLAPTCGS
jgi:hypothetical protein